MGNRVRRFYFWKPSSSWQVLAYALVMGAIFFAGFALRGEIWEGVVLGMLATVINGAFAAGHLQSRRSSGVVSLAEFKRRGRSSH